MKQFTEFMSYVRSQTIIMMCLAFMFFMLIVCLFLLLSADSIASIIGYGATFIICLIPFTLIWYGLLSDHKYQQSLNGYDMKTHIYRIGNFIIYNVSTQHMFYINDLTIRLGVITILLMWDLTENGRKHRTNYFSFSIFNRANHRVYYKRGGIA